MVEKERHVVLQALNVYKKRYCIMGSVGIIFFKLDLKMDSKSGYGELLCLDFDHFVSESVPGADQDV